MATIRAVVVDADAPAHLKIGAVEAPVPLPGEALVRVKALSLNRGETRGARTRSQARGPAGHRRRYRSGRGGRQRAEAGRPRRRHAAHRRLGELVAVPAPTWPSCPTTLRSAGVDHPRSRTHGALRAGPRRRAGRAQRAGHRRVRRRRQLRHPDCPLRWRHGDGPRRQEKHLQSILDAGAHHAVADETGMAAKEHGPYNLVLESVGGR